MNECTKCIKINKIEELEKEIENQRHTIKQHSNRIVILETFRDWASPILKKIEKMEKEVTSVAVSQKFMSAIFGAFVLIVVYIYTVQIMDFMKEQPQTKIEIIREIHQLDKNLNTRVDDLREDLTREVMKSSKINHNATVNKVKNAIKENKGE